MKVMTGHIVINGFVYDQFSSAKINSSWQNLSDTAEVVIPRSLYFALENLHEKIKVGAEIEIHLGYDGVNNIEFTGYITRVNTGMPVILYCEDKMWMLKQKKASVALRNASLTDLVNSLKIEYQTNVADIVIGDVLIEAQTIAQVLKMLQDEYNLYSYFDKGVLVVGKVYTDNSGTVVYDFEKNIPSGQDSLIYKSADDNKIKIIAESIKTDGTILNAEYGDNEGVENKLKYSGVNTADELAKLAENDYKRLKVNGLHGPITTFGEPFVRHGYTAKITSNQYPERAGTYYIESVNTEFTESGFRREVRIGQKAAEWQQQRS